MGRAGSRFEGEEEGDVGGVEGEEEGAAPAGDSVFGVGEYGEDGDDAGGVGEDDGVAGGGDGADESSDADDEDAVEDVTTEDGAEADFVVAADAADEGGCQFGGEPR